MTATRTLVDNFNDDSTDTGKWSTDAGGLAREVNGRLEIRPISGYASYGWYVSNGLFDLPGSEARVELVRPLRAAASSEAYLRVMNSGNDNVFITICHDGNAEGVQYVEAGQRASGVLTRLARQPYDPARHRWLRIREAQGIVYWETSPDGDAWEALAGRPTTVPLTNVRIDVGAGTWAAIPSPGVAIFDNVNVCDTSAPRRVEERRRSARDVRVEAAELSAARRHDEHHNNNDEVNYAGRPFIGNFSKSLKHDALGDPDPISYGTLLRALESRDPADFEEIALASSTALKLTNPQTGLTFDLEGPDPQALTQPPAPRFDSEVAAHEAGELYWMAVARDVPFINWGSHSDTAAAVTSLNGEFPRFGGTLPVNTQNLLRGIYPGEQVGPYVSQFLLKGNQDPRKPAGLGRDATDGYVSYGSRVIDQRLFPAAASTDYLTAFSSWLDVQNGWDRRGQDTFDTTRRFIHTLRAGTTLVHFDQVLDAWYNAAWILMSEPTGNQLSGSTARPQVDLEFPKDQGNPYAPPGTAMDSMTQVGFNTFGPTHLLSTLAEVLVRALRAVWFQKWFVHRRLRPEEYGGRVHNQITGARTYPLHTSIATSLQTGGQLAPYFGNTGERFPNGYLLPQAYPEGAPTHPAYGAGHATGSGAMATILKAFFDEGTPIENPVLAAADGLSLVSYTGADAGQMTVGGELNKLAGNIALFRNAAGVHWRSDYTESLPLGEAIAIGLLQEMSLGFNEDDAYFQLTRFDGATIRIFDGKVVTVTT
ncbi:MAG TPA: vanadium-dependent haloperoxidase [Longimicrobium sp.]|nr:vanadium-dependent haloperoxidase [Longimicrobium sp.]